MRFRTELTPEPLPAEAAIDYSSRLLGMGSCFADRVAARLAAAKFRVTANPFGVLFNPLSVAAALERFAAGEAFAAAELRRTPAGAWYHDDLHSSFDRAGRDEALAAANAAVAAGCRALRDATHVAVTFGTAWLYERAETGRVVANCRKLPASLFRRRRASVDEIVGRFEALLDGPLRGRHLILTVSPVRHLGDTLEGNAVSKALLRLAADGLAARHPDAVHYFPACELLLDDLRDYRFYADDLVHPAPAAVDYIWEKFAAAALTPRAQELLPRVERIVAAAAHRPFAPQSEAYRDFCRRRLAEIEAMAEVDFSAERAFFGGHLQINS